MPLLKELLMAKKTSMGAMLTEYLNFMNLPSLEQALSI